MFLPAWNVVKIGLVILGSYLTQCVAFLDKRNSTGLTNTVTWDPQSLSILGQRVFILSAEIHPWRQPNPNLWRDIFQKVKANGFNTVSFYVNWALHYPTPNSAPDFQEGTYRDLQRFIDEAKAAGLWLIARYLANSIIWTFLILCRQTWALYQWAYGIFISRGLLADIHFFL